MTVPELIAETLTCLRNQWYGDLIRDYKRDERALTKAIMLYGKECHDRGWQFDAKFIFSEIMRLLTAFKKSGTQINYLPVYLSNAIRQHIREHAEELSDHAKTIRPKTAKIIAGVKPVVVVEKSDVETCAAVYRDLAAATRRRHCKPLAKTAQPNLF